VREYRLDRGRRYQIVVDWLPGRVTECRLRVDDETVYLLRGAGEAGEAAFEVRSETPIAIHEFAASGRIRDRSRRP
jgi:hypothetical protein